MSATKDTCGYIASGLGVCGKPKGHSGFHEVYGTVLFTPEVAAASEEKPGDFVEATAGRLTKQMLEEAAEAMRNWRPSEQRYREHAEAALARAADELAAANRRADELEAECEKLSDRLDERDAKIEYLRIELDTYRTTAELLASRVLVLEKESLDAEQRFEASQAELRVVLEEKQATFDRLNAELIEEQRYGDDVRQGRDRALAEKGAAVEAERAAALADTEKAPSCCFDCQVADASRARGGKS